MNIYTILIKYFTNYTKQMKLYRSFDMRLGKEYFTSKELWG